MATTQELVANRDAQVAKFKQQQTDAQAARSPTTATTASPSTAVPPPPIGQTGVATDAGVTPQAPTPSIAPSEQIPESFQGMTQTSGAKATTDLMKATDQQARANLTASGVELTPENIQTEYARLMKSQKAASTVATGDKFGEKVDQAKSWLTDEERRAAEAAKGTPAPKTPAQEAADAETAAIDLETNKYLAEIERMRASGDEQLKRTIDNIQAMFEQRRAETKDLNARTLATQRILGIRSGRQRYAGEIHTGILSAEEAAGIKRLTELDRQEIDAVQTAKTALESRDFELLSKAYEENKAARAEKRVVMQNLQQTMMQEEEMRMKRRSFQIQEEEYFSKQMDTMATNYATNLLTIDSEGNIQPPDQKALKALSDKTGVPIDKLMGAVGARYDELRKMGLEDAKFALDQMKAMNDAINDSKTTEIKNYEYAQSQGYTGTIIQYNNMIEAAKKAVQDSATYGVEGLPTNDPLFFVLGTNTSAQANKQNIARVYKSMIDEGKYKEADAYLNQIARQSFTNEEKTAYDLYNGLMGTAKKVEDALVGQVGANKYKTLLESGKSWIAASKDPKWLALTADIEARQAIVRHALSGAALTPSEMENINKFMVNFNKDTLNDAQIKLQSMEDLNTEIRTRLLNDKKGVFVSPEALSPQVMAEDVMVNLYKNNPEVFAEVSAFKKANQGVSDEDILREFGLMPGGAGMGGGGAETSFTYDNKKYVGYTPQVLNKALGIDPETFRAQCGRLINGATNIGVGDSYQSKMDKTDPSIKAPQAGLVFVMPTSEKWGHTGIVAGVDWERGVILAYDSNWRSKSAPETVYPHEIPIKSITGYARPKPNSKLGKFIG